MLSFFVFSFFVRLVGGFATFSAVGRTVWFRVALFSVGKIPQNFPSNPIKTPKKKYHSSLTPSLFSPSPQTFFKKVQKKTLKKPKKPNPKPYS